MVSNKEKSQVAFIEDYLYIDFEGDLNNKQEVNEFINEYLDEAEAIYNELKCEYEVVLVELI